MTTFTECEHNDIEPGIKPDGSNDPGALVCMECGAFGMQQPPDEDGEIFTDWVKL